MITDLRNDLYNAGVRRSVAFFLKHTTGTLRWTLVYDIWRVHFAMSRVLGDFLRRLFTANLRSVSAQAISSPLMDALGSVGIALLLYFGRQRILHNYMTAGSFITFLIAVFTLYDPVRKFALFYNSFQQALGASEDIFKFMDAQDDVREKKRAYALKGFSKGIQFENVGFAYASEDGENKQVLWNINLAGKPGEVIPFVWPRGAGEPQCAILI